MNIRGQRMDLWRAGDSEGEVLDMLVPAKRDTAAALKLMKKLLKKQQMVPDEIATDGLPRRSISTVCCRSLPSVRSVIRSRLKVKPVRSLPKHAGWRLAGHRLDALCRSDCASPRLRPRDGDALEALRWDLFDARLLHYVGDKDRQICSYNASENSNRSGSSDLPLKAYRAICGRTRWSAFLAARARSRRQR